MSDRRPDAEQGPAAAGRPIAQVHVDVTHRCNLRCVYCFTPRQGPPPEDMTLADYRRLAGNVFPHTDSVHFDGCGEPLLHPSLPEMIRVARDYGLLVEMSTNGTVLDDKRLGALESSPPDCINISMDALEPGVLERLRPGAAPERARERIAALVKRLRGTEIKLHVVGTMTAIRALEHTVRAAAELGIRKVNCGTAYNVAEVAGEESPVDHAQEARAAYARARAGAEACGVDLQTGPLDAKDAGGCVFGVDKNFIVRSDGTVGPCCALFWREALAWQGVRAEPGAHGDFGNAFEEPFERFWNEPRYVAFRAALADGRTPPVCRACPAHYGLW